MIVRVTEYDHFDRVKCQNEWPLEDIYRPGWTIDQQAAEPELPQDEIEEDEQPEDVQPSVQSDSVAYVEKKAPEVIPRSEGWQKPYASNASLQGEKARDVESAPKHTQMEYRMPPETECLKHGAGYAAPYGGYQAPAPYGYRQYPVQYPAQQNFPTSLEIANAVTIPVDPIMGANNY